MNDTIHHTLMATYMTFHKQVSLKILKEKLQPGQPKVLEFLKENDGSEQKEIARECCLDPATVTGILGRMERLIIRIGSSRKIWIMTGYWMDWPVLI